jgi:hypothetical protein
MAVRYRLRAPDSRLLLLGSGFSIAIHCLQATSAANIKNKEREGWPRAKSPKPRIVKTTAIEVVQEAW